MITQIFGVFLRPLSVDSTISVYWNAILVPSGDHTGLKTTGENLAGKFVKGLAPLPSAFITQMLLFETNISLDPSGDQSGSVRLAVTIERRVWGVLAGASQPTLKTPFRGSQAGVSADTHLGLRLKPSFVSRGIPSVRRRCNPNRCVGRRQAQYLHLRPLLYPEKVHLRPLLMQNGSLILNDLERQWKSAISDERATAVQQAL